VISTARTSPIATRSIAHDVPVLDIIPDVDFSAPLSTPTELLQEGYAKRLAGWSVLAAEMPEYPHAAALIDLLREASEDVIRGLPSAARDALAFCDDLHVSRTRLASLLGKDPALVLRLLRTANSAAMGTGKTVLSTDGAIARIGMISTRSVVFAHSVEGLLSRPGLPFEDMVRNVWDHMITTGPIARTIAPAFGANAEEAFSVALLHDVGKLVVFDQITALRTRQRSPVVLPTGWVSSFLLDIHEPLGALAAARWGMGEPAAAAIGAHHRAGDLGAHALAETVFVAERVDHAQRRGLPVEMDDIFQQGHLTGSPERVQQLLSAIASKAN
jgi:HD-like signal output (HDOD) protein